MFYQAYAACKAAEITPGSDGMVPSVAAWRYLQRARSIPSLPGGAGRGQRVFVPGDLGLWPWKSSLSERGTKHIFSANVVRICTVVLEIFHTQIKNKTKKRKVTDSTKNKA